MCGPWSGVLPLSLTNALPVGRCGDRSFGGAHPSSRGGAMASETKTTGDAQVPRRYTVPTPWENRQ